ncbi:IPT/TIG domain-containing protein [Fulvivirga lutea]|uniref:IPT/TIG domain-containing protein n=1 Tax=Fulvivirga lutea TaxID=2810512 RepID=A0A974WDP5_9BACT|nr:IPT/TIG domain-containing protein [Fulvivirga lutea]QSE96208.1 IPT/TIG domain-containing protein [Fulvivirga lutea]
MKSYIKIITVSAILISCKNDERLVREYPIPVLTEIVSIEDNSATFGGVINNIENSNIQEYGFLIRLDDKIRYDNSEIIKMTDLNNLQNFHGVLDRVMIADRTYYVVAYAKTNKFTIYGGDVMSYTAKGSFPPKILEVSPMQGKADDEVLISGEKFSSNFNKTWVYPDKNDENLILANSHTISDKEVILFIPPVLESGDYKILIQSGGVLVSSSQTIFISN